MGRFFFSIAAVVSCCVSAQAQTQDSALLEGLGIDGRWAKDCRKPASEANPYLTYTTPNEGQPTETASTGSGEDHVSQLLDVQWLKTRELVWVIPEGEVMITVVTKLEGNRMRTWSSGPTEGAPYIVKGKSGDGKPTPWLNKCETN